MGNTKEDNTVIAMTLSKLPDEYATIRTNARNQERRGELTFDNLMADIRSHYRSEITYQKVFKFGKNDYSSEKKMKRL